LQTSVVRRRISALCTNRSVGGSRTIGSTATSSFYDGLNPVQELQLGAPSANTITGLGIDEYFQRTDSSGASSYLTDALGTTLALANPAGGLATSYTYDPFGNTTIAGSSTNPFQFTGRENDGTGLYYNRARYYSPTTQRFIDQDPADTLSSGSGLYTYVSNDPADLVDPLGLYTCFYSISSHRLVCIPDDPNDPLFESNNFASGAPGSCRDNPKCQASENEGPIPQGEYMIGADRPDKKKMWRRLTPDNGRIPPGRKGGFGLHLWGLNEWCIMTHSNTGDVLDSDLDLEEGSNTLQVNP